MSHASKSALRKPIATGKTVQARASLRRSPVAPPVVPDANGEEALGRAWSSLLKGSLVALVLMITSASAYTFIMQNQHKSVQELVLDIIASPAPTLVSRVSGCSVPSVPHIMPDLAFSAELPVAIGQVAQAAEAVTLFTDCILTDAARRVCSIDQRTTLVADLKVHAHMRATLATFVGAARTVVPDARFDQYRVGVVQGDLARAVERLDLEVTRADEVVVKVASLVQAGLLVPSDFGAFGRGVPPMLAAVFNAAAAAKAQCRG